MRVGIFLNTPAHVHFYRNIAAILEKAGHDSIFLARDYRETIQLLNELGVSHIGYSNTPESGLGKLPIGLVDMFKAYKHLCEFKPDIVTGFGVYSALSSMFLGKPCVVFTDSEPRIRLSYSIQYKTVVALVDAMITPTSFMEELGPKQVKVNSYKELAYLHPNYFSPGEDIFDWLELDKGEDYALLRFNAFDAVHDFKMSGFSLEDKKALVEELSKHTNVFVSTEGEIPGDIKEYKLEIPKSKIHDALYYAKLLVTDTQTMATEAAVLGTPAIRSNMFVGKNDMGNFLELERKYGLLFNIRDPKSVIEKAKELIQDPDLKREWRNKREKMLRDKVDITEFMVWFIENYPRSFRELKKNPNGSQFGSHA